MTQTTTLKQFIFHGGLGGKRLPAYLDGKAEGGWAETQQAVREIEGAMPYKRQRAGWTLRDLIATMYRVEGDGRSAGIYRLRTDAEIVAKCDALPRPEAS